MNPVIQVDGLGKSFGATRALDGVDLAVRRGTVLGLLGPNGSGKTTTVRVLATLLRPDSGRARVLGHDVVAEPEAVRARIGLTGQYAAVDEALSGTDNLVLVARLLGLSRREARQRAAELIGRFGLAAAAGRRVRTYSGGMRRRLDLAVSLVGRPDVLFLDEPTTGLDPRRRNEVWDEVRGLAADGTTVLLTTQYLEEAEQLADDLVVLDHGRVIAAGTPAALKAEVGGQRLHARPLHPADLPAVTALVAGLMPGSVSAVDAAGELTVAGIFDRFRSLPISRTAPLLGAIGADLVRYVTSGAIMLAFGFALGFRTNGGVLGVLAALGLVTVFALRCAGCSPRWRWWCASPARSRVSGRW